MRFFILCTYGCIYDVAIWENCFACVVNVRLLKEAAFYSRNFSVGVFNCHGHLSLSSQVLSVVSYDSRTVLCDGTLGPGGAPSAVRSGNCTVI